MTARWRSLGCWVALAAALAAPRTASAHFLWITVDPPAGTGGASTIQLFLSERPVPEGPAFLKAVQGVTPRVGSQALPVSQGEETIDARWVGKLPATIDAERDLGVSKRGETTMHLYYTARAQTEVLDADSEEAGEKLRVRLVAKDGKKLLQVLFDGQPVAKARIKLYPDGAAATEATADDEGLAAVDGLAEGTTAVWANWNDGKPGELDGKAFPETRYYATLTFQPAAAEAPAESEAKDSVPTAFATMPDPAVNSFGGAVLGDWLYVYGGHVGRTHHYNKDTTAKHFRRLNLKDRTTWEDLPLPQDLQGVALVSDGKALYRVGGMVARNEDGEDHDLHSVADFARFDPETKTWTDLAPMPRPRSTHDAIVIGQTLYVSGGWCMEGEDGSPFLEDTLAFDLAQPEAGWKSIPQPFKRRALSVGEAGGKLYVLGGLSGEGMNVESRVDIYDPKTETWSLGPNLPKAGRTDGFGTSAFNVDGRLYYSGSTGRIFRLSEAGDSWELVGAWALPRITHRILPGPGRSLLAVGGNAKGRQTPVIEAVELPPASPRAASGGG
jgi:hypothetical protein